MKPEACPLTPWLTDLRAGLADARGPGTIEGIHDLRVATRRVDVFLRLGGWRVLRDDVRWVRALAAPVRDLDVLIEMDAPVAAVLDRVARREAARLLLAESLASPRVEDLLTALSLLPPLPRARVERGVGRLAGRLLDQKVDPSNPADVHARRRALRRLRYALELLDEPLDALVVLQDALGAVSDGWVRIHLSSEPPDPGALAPALAAAEAAWLTHLPAIEALRR